MGLASANVWSASSYMLIDLGDLAGGTDSSAALSINDSGLVSGWGRDAGGQRATLWANGLPANLVPGSTSTGYAINDAGVVVGTYGSTVHGFVMSSGGLTDLGDLAGGSNYSFASSINNSGVVVGYSSGYVNGSSGAATMRAVMWNGSTMTQLGSLNDGLTGVAYASYAYDINDAGAVVGYSSAGTSSRAVVWQNGSITDLGVLAGTTTSKAFAINDLGVAVGASGNSAALWDKGSVRAIDSFAAATGAAVAYDINDSGLVVGQVKVNGGYAGFLWDEQGGMVSLNSLLGDAAGWNITDARGINGNGLIAATATFNGVSHAVLLQPVPEPATAAMLLAGLLGVFGFARRTGAREQ